MAQRIIYMDPQTGTTAVIVPSPFCDISIEHIALKDVPPGVPYMIVDEGDLPTDFTFLHAWEADFSEPHGAGADYGTGSDNEVIDWNEDGTPVLRSAE